MMRGISKRTTGWWVRFRLVGFPLQFCARQRLEKLSSINVMHLLGPRTVECRHNSSLVKGPEQGYSTVLLANLSQIT